MSEPTQADHDRQRADHFQQLYEAASIGKCGYSGMTFRDCKITMCDCFEFEWIKESLNV